MNLHEINRRIVDLRHSELDESELDALNKEKSKIEAKLEKAKKAKAPTEELDTELFLIEENIKKIQKEYEDERKAGHFKFKNKVYVSYKGGTNRRPPYHFSWCRYSPSNNYADLNDWMYSYGYTPVQYGKDPFWPESVQVNASNYYIFGDLIWVKCSLLEYLRAKAEEQALQKRGGQAEIDKIREEIDRYGMTVPDSMLEGLA